MIGVIVNLRARGARRDPGLVGRLSAAVGPRGEVAAPDSPDAVAAVLDGWRARGLRTLGIHGGDGTGHRVLTALMTTWLDALPEVLWMTGGTMNTVSRSMGQRGRPEAQLAALLNERDGGPRLLRTRRWPLCVDGQHHGFLFGLGIVRRFIEVYEAGAEPSPAKAAWTLGRAVASAFVGGAFAEQFFAGMPLRVTTDGVRWPDRAWRILTVGAVDQIGLGFRPTPAVLDAPGCFEAYASAAPPAAFARALPGLFTGRGPLGADETRAVARELVIEGDGPLDWNLDGDLGTSPGRVTVRTTRPVTFLLAPGARPPANRLGP